MMASCEAWLLRQKIISGPFTAKEIAEGALWDHLTQEDYDAPLKVNFLSLQVTCDLPVNNVQLPHFSLTTSNSLVVATHILLFYFRGKHDWQPRLMPLRHQPGNLWPSSLKKFPRRSRRVGKKVTPSSIFYPSIFSLPSS